MNRTFLGMLGVSVVAVVALAMSGSASASTPTNGRIAFYRADVAADSSSCFTIDPDGTDEHQVAPGTSMFCGTWSPDSSKLLESPFPNGFARPATSNPDGSGYTVLDAYPNLQQNIGCGFWSPDGARFLCSSDDGLYTVRSSDGGDLQRVTHSPEGYSDYQMGYSPDGSHILFNRVSDNDINRLFSVKPDGSGLRQLSPEGVSVIDLGFFDAVSADWSPNGSRVVFAAAKCNVVVNQGCRNALFVENADGTVLRQITPNGLGGLTAQWSPDGREIAFTSCCGSDPAAGPEVWLVHPDGSGLTQITSPTNGRQYAPIWSPNGQKLLYQRDLHSGKDLVTVNADRTGLSKLADIPADSDGSAYAWGSAPPIP